jgi:hypothetical protein
VEVIVGAGPADAVVVAVGGTSALLGPGGTPASAPGARRISSLRATRIPNSTRHPRASTPSVATPPPTIQARMLGRAGADGGRVACTGGCTAGEGAGPGW